MSVNPLMKGIALVFPVIIVAGFGLSCLRTQGNKLEKRPSATVSSVDLVVPVALNVTREIINQSFNQGSDLGRNIANRFPAESKFHRFYLYGNDRIPSETQLRERSTLDASIRRYLEIDSMLRKDDLFLSEPSGDYYWHTEYYLNGESAKFKCEFIIHLEQTGSSQTKIEVLEYFPRVWAGKKFVALGHSGPGYYQDIRDVEPTTADRVEVLKIVEKGIGNQVKSN
jgi:hypothetical protein